MARNVSGKKSCVCTCNMALYNFNKEAFYALRAGLQQSYS